MIKLLVKFTIAALSVPAAVGISMAFYRNFILIKELASSINYFLYGIAAYTALHLLLYKPTYLYVLGHEAVHAGMSWIFGGKIKSFKVSSEGGSVGTSKSNFLIELGPYFVPLYAIIIAVVYIVIASSYNINGSIFVFLIGFALAFHLISTVEIMKIRQPDIVKSGYFFSVVLVYVLNIAVMSVIFGMLFPSFSTKRFFTDTFFISRDIYAGVFRQLFL